MTKLAGALLAMIATAIVLSGVVLAMRAALPYVSDPDVQFWMKIIGPWPAILAGLVFYYRQRRTGRSFPSIADD